MARKTACLLSATLLAAVLVPGAGAGTNRGTLQRLQQPPTSRLYQGPTSGSNARAQIYLNHLSFGTTSGRSRGYGIGRDWRHRQLLQAGADRRRSKAGSIFYSSSGLTYSGTYYQTNVGIMQTNTGAAGAGILFAPGAQLATSKVTVLAIDRCARRTGKCGPPVLWATWGSVTTAASHKLSRRRPEHSNAFTSIVSLASRAPLSTYRQGYVSHSGVTLGLSSDAT